MAEKFRSTLDYLERGSGPLHLERLIEFSNCGRVPDKRSKGSAGMTRAVALTLARCANCEVKGYEGIPATFLSHHAIAQASLFSVDTVQRSITTLIQTGYVVSIPRPRSTNMYLFVVAKLRNEAIPAAEAAQESKRRKLEAAHAERERLMASIEFTAGEAIIPEGLNEDNVSRLDNLDDDDDDQPFMATRTFGEALNRA